MNDSEEQIKLFSEASIPRYLPPNGQKTFGPADENESKNNDDHDEIQPLYSVREMVKREEEQVDVMMRQKKKKDKRRIRYVNASDHASESDATDHGNDGDMHRTNDRLQRLQLQHISTIDADDGDGVGSQRNTGSGSTLFIDDTTLNALLRGRALESPDAASIQQEREHQMTKRHRTRRGDLPQDNRRRQGGATPRSARTHRSREGLIGVSPPDMDPDSASISEVGHINQRLALIDTMKGSLADLQPRELGKYTLKRAPLLSAASGSLLGARQHGMAKHFHDGEGNNNENENDDDNSNELNESGFFSARSGVSLGASPHTPHSPTSVASLGSYRSDHSQAAQEEKLKTKADGDLIMKLLQEVRQMPGLFAQAEEQKKVHCCVQVYLSRGGGVH